MEPVRKHSAIYHSPYAMALYFWTFWLSGLTLHVTLLPRLVYDPRLSTPLLWGGLIALFLVLFTFRVTLVDLQLGMSYRERFGVFLIIFTFFLAPLVISDRASLLFCLCVMHYPLLALLSDNRSFERMYLNTLIILTLFGIEQFGHPLKVLWIYCLAGALLTACFVLDFYTFRAERFGRLEHVRIFRAHLLAAGFYLVAITFAGVIFWLQPEFKRPPAPARTMLERPSMQDVIEGQGVKPMPQITRKDMMEILISTLLLLAALMGFIALLFYLRKRRWKRMAEQHQEETIGEALGVMTRRRSTGKPRRDKKAPHSPREAIERTYVRFCEWTATRYRERKADETAREYNMRVAEAIPTLASGIDLATHPFEAAKYDVREPDWEDAEQYQQHLDNLLDSASKE